MSGQNGNGTLPLKQQRFVDEYLKDLNATRAYAATYGVKSANVAAACAARLKKLPRIATAIDMALGNHSAKPVTEHIGSQRRLYFILNPVTQLIKIGVSSDIPDRLRSLEMAGGIELRLLAVWPNPDFEKTLHVAFADDRRVGEWFAADRVLKLLLPEVNE